MKKALAILITVCLLASLFVSCDNNAKIDELVSVSFDALDTRALEVNNEAFIDIQAPSLVWEYMATKVSDVKYNVGAASTWTPIPGITPGKITNVVEFSQGKWNFELRAVTKDEAGNVTCVIYYGKTDIATPVLLTKQSGGAKYYIPINLTAQLSGQKGYIVLSNISVKHLSSGTEILDAPSKVFIDGKELASGNYTSTGTSISTASKGLEYTVGTHRVKVQKIGANGEVLAEEEKTIEVYAGLKTTVSNWIVEITQGGQFAPVAPTGTTTESIPASEEYVTLTVANVSPSMTSGNGTSVTVPTSIFNDKTKPVTVKVSVKEATEASNSFTASSTSNAVAAVIDLTLLEGDTQKTDFGDSTVLVETYVAKNLDGFLFGYPGETWTKKESLAAVTAAKDYYYDSTEGKLTFLTDHFSSFIVETSSAAIIGDTAYKTLADAINGASDGDTIVLLDNTSVSNTSITLKEGKTCISIQDKGITIDGNGKAITLSAGAPDYKTYGIYITGDSSKTVTIKNATINTTELERAIRTEGSIGVNIVDCTISTNGVGVHVKGSNKVDIINTQITVDVIDNSTFSAHLRTAVMVGGVDADVTVNGCTINAVNENKTTDKNTLCKGLYVGSLSKNAKITANDTNVVADFSIAIDGAQNDHTPFEEKPTQIIINSGEYSGLFGSPSGLSYKSLIINGGTFSGISAFDSFNSKDNDVAKLVISGGTFNVKPGSQFIVDYYCAVAQGDKWIVQEAPVVIGTTGYATLEDAISKVGTGETIKLMKDTSGNGIVVATGSNFTVDFNSHTYNIDGTTVGSTGTETNGFQLLKGSTILFKNGTIQSSKAGIIIQNYSNLTLDNMTLDGSDLPNYLWKTCYVLSNNNGNVTIKDTTISTSGSNVAFDVCRYTSYVGPHVTVEGNSVINGKVEISSSGAKEDAVHKLTVTGGTFNGKICKSGSSPDFVGDIKGGTFTSNPSDYVASGYGCRLTADGKYEVVSMREAGYINNPLPTGPTKNGDVWTVTPVNAQFTLDGAYGSIDGKTIIFSAGEYPQLEFGRATKYAGSNTDYYIGGVSEENKKTFDDFYAIKNSGTWSASAYYMRNINNVTLKAAEGANVTVHGLVALSGHVYGEVYDYVLDKAYTSGSAYYLSQNISNTTFENIKFDAKVDIATSSADTNIDGVSFKNCSFTTGETKTNNGQGLRYYNENDNGKVKNLTVEGCRFNNCYQGVYTQKINGITVTGCSFGTTGHNAIAVQSGSEAVNHKAVVITGNKFSKIGDRIIRFGDVASDTQITIKNNTATNSGDRSGQIMKAQSLAEGVTYDISGNNWGEGKTVANSELADR